MIIGIEPSPVKYKRFRVTVNTAQGQKKFDFGLKDGSTFIDGESETVRQEYLKRHLGNATEERLIKNLVPSPALFSAFLLWGKYRSINLNIKYLNNLWNK
jgi:hypothetical protein